MTRVVLAMSGGVDSSVAAHLLLEAGNEVVGVFMRHGEDPVTCDSTPSPGALPIINQRFDHKQGCCSASDALDARRVADRFGVPFYALNLQDDFDRIIDYFVDEYVSGRTPNPCVVCNTWLKFGKLFDYADSVGAEYVATGHYARLEPTEDQGPLALCRGLDGDKDQSYVLFGVERQRLERMLLPVGQYRKSEIRQMATDLSLGVADKRDSQEICFVTSGRHAEFVRQRQPNAETEGQIVTTAGEVVGRHEGIEGFTIGQRKGLGIAMGEPYYVVAIERHSNRVVIGHKQQLARTELTAGRANWLVEAPSEPIPCLAQIRYNSSAQPATVFPLDASEFRVEFEEPCFGVAPGQAVVCYANDRVMGGGWIVS